MPSTIVPRYRQSWDRLKFDAFFGSLKTVTYHDPSSRGGSSHTIRTIAWNPLGTLVATGSSDRTLRVWNPDRQHIKFSTELKGHAAGVEKVAFNPVKESQLCSVSSDGVAKFWEVRTKTVINEVKGLGEAITLAWSPDGEQVVIGNKADNLFILSPTQTTPLSSHQQSIQTNQIVFCSRGEKVFVTTGEGRVRILSYPEFQPIIYSSSEPKVEFTLNGHTSSCLSAELQPTGRWLATGGSDSIIALWDTTDWLCHRTLTEMTGAVKSISFSHDGSYIVGGSDEGAELKFAHVETGEIVHTVKTAGPSPVVAWHPNKYVFAYTDLGSLKIIGVDPERK